MDELSLILEQSLYHALHVRNLSPLYISSVRSTCKSYFEHAKVRAVYECTQDNIEAWLLDGRAFRNWSAATFRSKHRDLGFLFQYLLKRGKIQVDPTKGIELPKLGTSLPRSISLEDAEKLLAYTRRARYAYKFEAARNYAMIALMFHTGLRKSEVIHLKMEDFINANRESLSLTNASSVRILRLYIVFFHSSYQKAATLESIFSVA